MLMSEDTKQSLNNLIQLSFQMNAFCDNIAYNLDFYVYPQTSKIEHEYIAHKFPEFADILSDLMIKLNARPVRVALGPEEKDYNGDLIELFKDMDKGFEGYRKSIISTIQTAEFNDDFEVKIALEDFLLKFLPYRKQISIWATEIERYENDYEAFDARIKTFTTVIPLKKGDENNG